MCFIIVDIEKKLCPKPKKNTALTVMRTDHRSLGWRWYVPCGGRTVEQDAKRNGIRTSEKTVRFPWIIAIPWPSIESVLLQYMLAAIPRLKAESAQMEAWSNVFGGGNWQGSSLAKPTQNSWCY
jgi:hypothetical protein